MVFSEKLQIHRKNKGLTQEELAEKLSVSRQAVAKWEFSLVFPDIYNLIQISNLMNVSVDYLVKDQECTVNPFKEDRTDLDELIAFCLGDGAHIVYVNGDYRDTSTPIGEQIAKTLRLPLAFVEELSKQMIVTPQ